MVDEWISKIIQKNRLLSDIKKRYELGFQNALLFTGDTNTGKTKFALIVYYLISKGILGRKRLDMKDDLFCYSISDFSKVLADIEQQCIFYDEAGVELDIGNWNSAFNRMLSHILQTQRVKRNFYFFILPHKRLITQTHWVLFNYYIIVNNELQAIYDKKNEITHREIKRIAYTYKIKTQHFDFSECNHYVNYYSICRYNIPDYSKGPEWAEFRKFVAIYEKYERERKQSIARDIEKETRVLMKRKEIQAQKTWNEAEKLGI